MKLNNVKFLPNPWVSSAPKCYTPKHKEPVQNTDMSSSLNFIRLQFLFPLIPECCLCEVLTDNGGDFMKAVDTLIYKYNISLRTYNILNSTFNNHNPKVASEDDLESVIDVEKIPEDKPHIKLKFTRKGNTYFSEIVL